MHDADRMDVSHAILNIPLIRHHAYANSKYKAEKYIHVFAEAPAAAAQ